MKKWVLAVTMLMVLGTGLCQADERGWFAGYELIEMASNEFSNFAGEVGYRIDEKQGIRLTIMEVSLTERHLSSKYEAYAVDGRNVKGYLRGYELNYDRFFSRRWYYSLNVGYYNDIYEHTILDEKLENYTATAGVGVGFRQNDLFGLDGLYLNLNMPFRYYFNSIKETKLGETTVRPHVFVNNLWLFIGYDF